MLGGFEALDSLIPRPVVRGVQLGLAFTLALAAIHHSD